MRTKATGNNSNTCRSTSKANSRCKWIRWTKWTCNIIISTRIWIKCKCSSLSPSLTLVGSSICRRIVTCWTKSSETQTWFTSKTHTDILIRARQISCQMFKVEAHKQRWSINNRCSNSSICRCRGMVISISRMDKTTKCLRCRPYQSPIILSRIALPSKVEEWAWCKICSVRANSYPSINSFQTNKKSNKCSICSLEMRGNKPY